MLYLVLGLAMAAGFQEEPAQDLTKEFTELCDTLGKAENYAFKLVMLSEGGGFGMRRMSGGDEGEKPEPTRVSGKFMKGQPSYFKTGEVEAYVMEETTVYRMGEDKWQPFDPRSMRDAFRGGRGGREGRQRERDEEAEHEEGDEEAEHEEGEGEGEKKPDEEEARPSEDRRASMRSLFSLRRITLPHEAIKRLQGKVTDITREDEETEGKVVYTCAMTAEGAEAMAGRSRFGRRGGGGGPTFDRSGTLRVTSSSEGKIEKIEIITKTSGSFRDQDFEQTSTVTFELEKVGKVEYEAPEEVMAEFAL